jgi:hypothetical protein
MEDKINQPAQNNQTSKTLRPAPKANESAGLNIDEHVKIFDPETSQVWLETRA